MVTVSRRPKENNATLDVEIDIHDDGNNFFFIKIQLIKLYQKQKLLNI